MQFVVWQRRLIAAVGPVLCLGVLSGTPAVHAASLSISGITEGAVLRLPGGVASTNLSVSLSGSGLGPAPMAELSLEWQGGLQRRLTSAVPAAVVFSNLPAGKYFLEAHGLAEPSVLADLSFDLQPASLQPANDFWAQ